MLRTLSLFTATAVAMVSSAVAQQDAPTLSVGDPAPALTIGTWVNGDPVTEFQDGQVYVVEFWATWCKPCVDAFPHLTKLQEQYDDKATVIGVNIWERAEGKARTDMVTDFVAKQGERMGYTVAIESGTSMAESWMTAAGRRGIPSAFIVDKAGKVAWMGRPMAMDAPRAPLVAGAYDMGSAAEAAAKKAANDAKAQAIMTEVNALWENDQKALALDKLDEVVELDANEYGVYAVNKLEMLMVSPELQDIPAAHAYAARLRDSLAKDNAQVLNGAAWMLLTADEGKNPELARTIAARANTLAEGKDASILDTLAKAHFDTGDKAGAIAMQTKAIEMAEDAGMREELKAALDIYKNQ